MSRMAVWRSSSDPSTHDFINSFCEPSSNTSVKIELIRSPLSKVNTSCNMNSNRSWHQTYSSAILARVSTIFVAPFRTRNVNVVSVGSISFIWKFGGHDFNWAHSEPTNLSVSANENIMELTPIQCTQNSPLTHAIRAVQGPTVAGSLQIYRTNATNTVLCSLQAACEPGSRRGLSAPSL